MLFAISHKPYAKLHDLHLANQIVKLAKEHAAKNKAGKITKIVVELGEVLEHGEAITPENLKYNINLLMPCEVKVKNVKGDKWKLISIEAK